MLIAMVGALLCFTPYWPVGAGMILFALAFPDCL